jgi:hypothetical protein
MAEQQHVYEIVVTGNADALEQTLDRVDQRAAKGVEVPVRATGGDGGRRPPKTSSAAPAGDDDSRQRYRDRTPPSDRTARPTTDVVSTADATLRSVNDALARVRSVFERMGLQTAHLPSAGAVVAANQPRTTRQFSKSAIEKQIVDAVGHLSGDRYVDAQAEKVFSEHAATTFYKKLPTEVSSFIKGQPNLASMFNVTKERGKAEGEDAMGLLGQSRYFDYVSRVREGKAGEVRRAVELARTHPDPEIQHLAAMYDNPDLARAASEQARASRPTRRQQQDPFYDPEAEREAKLRRQEGRERLALSRVPEQHRGAVEAEAEQLSEEFSMDRLGSIREATRRFKDRQRAVVPPVAPAEEAGAVARNRAARPRPNYPSNDSPEAVALEEQARHERTAVRRPAAGPAASAQPARITPDAELAVLGGRPVVAAVQERTQAVRRAAEAYNAEAAAVGRGTRDVEGGRRRRGQARETSAQREEHEAYVASIPGSSARRLDLIEQARNPRDLRRRVREDSQLFEASTINMNPNDRRRAVEERLRAITPEGGPRAGDEFNPEIIRLQRQQDQLGRQRGLARFMTPENVGRIGIGTAVAAGGAAAFEAFNQSYDNATAADRFTVPGQLRARTGSEESVRRVASLVPILGPAAAELGIAGRGAFDRFAGSLLPKSAQNALGVGATQQEIEDIQGGTQLQNENTSMRMERVRSAQRRAATERGGSAMRRLEIEQRAAAAKEAVDAQLPELTTEITNLQRVASGGGDFSLGDALTGGGGREQLSTAQRERLNKLNDRKRILEEQKKEIDKTAEVERRQLDRQQLAGRIAIEGDTRQTNLRADNRGIESGFSRITTENLSAFVSADPEKRTQVVQNNLARLREFTSGLGRANRYAIEDSDSTVRSSRLRGAGNDFDAGLNDIEGRRRQRLRDLPDSNTAFGWTYNNLLGGNKVRQGINDEEDANRDEAINRRRLALEDRGVSLRGQTEASRLQRGGFTQAASDMAIRAQFEPELRNLRRQTQTPEIKTAIEDLNNAMAEAIKSSAETIRDNFRQRTQAVSAQRLANEGRPVAAQLSIFTSRIADLRDKPDSPENRLQIEEQQQGRRAFIREDARARQRADLSLTTRERQVQFLTQRNRVGAEVAGIAANARTEEMEFLDQQNPLAAARARRFGLSQIGQAREDYVNSLRLENSDIRNVLPRRSSPSPAEVLRSIQQQERDLRKPAERADGGFLSSLFERLEGGQRGGSSQAVKIDKASTNDIGRAAGQAAAEAIGTELRNWIAQD